jgi:hypothetical protein
VDPDPDPGGPKTCGSGGSGSGTLNKIQFCLQVQKFQKQISKSINANIEAELMLKAQKAHEGKPFHTLGKVLKWLSHYI